jgi:RimJ/RimL family protein N-acetyltransferase
MAEQEIDLMEARSFTLAGRTVTIRRMTAADGAAVLAFARSVPTNDLLFLQRDIRHERVVAAWIRQIESDQIVSLLAFSGDDRLIGCTAVVQDDLSWSPHVAEIRVLIGLEGRGTGLGTLLAQLCIEDAVQRGATKALVRMTPDQDAAFKVFEDMGFRPEALLREHVRHPDGRLEDLVVLGLDLQRQGAQHLLYGLENAPSDAG